MTKKREWITRQITLDKEINKELELKKLLTGTPVSRQLENFYKEFKKRME